MRSGLTWCASTPVKFFRSLGHKGPLSTLLLTCEAVERRAGQRSLVGRPFVALKRGLKATERYLDGRFDRRFGTETSGVIALRDLDIQSDNLDAGIWYEPMSPTVFRQIMNHLNISCPQYEFIDFGSGKGRVLLLASQYGFKKVTGVEFSEELHQAALANVSIWSGGVPETSIVETRCIDAVDFAIPDSPLVVFFYSPFMGRVMERVLGNIVESWKRSRRNLVLSFYGSNAESIELLRATQFSETELSLRADWTRLKQYRGFIFRSPSPIEGGSGSS